MGLFTKTRPEHLRPLFRRIARLEAATHQTATFSDRSPFSEERARLFSLYGQDAGLAPDALGARVATDPDGLTADAVAWQTAIDADVERAALDEDVARLGRGERRWFPEISAYVTDKGRFGAQVDDAYALLERFDKLGSYLSYAPSRRGFLFGRTRMSEVAGQPIAVLEDETLSGRYSLAFRGMCDKLWHDLTYVRPASIAFAIGRARPVLTGASPVESTALRRAKALFDAHHGGDLAAFETDLTWWVVRDLVVRREQRHAIRRERTCPLIERHALAPAGLAEDVYWIFHEVLAEMQILLELEEHPLGPRLTAARAIDHLIEFEPPRGEAPFYYDHRLQLVDAHLTEHAGRQLLRGLRKLEEMDEYHTLLRESWGRIQGILGPPPDPAPPPEESS